MTDYTISPECNDLIKALYQGPLEEQPWQTFLRLFRDAVTADFATLLLRPPKQGDSGIVLNAAVLSPEVYQAYNENYFALDSFVNLPHGEVVTLREYMDEAELESSEYFLRYMQPIGVHHIMGADLTDTSGMNVRLRVTRGELAGDFGAREKAICALILPHLLQSIELNSQIQHSQTEREVLENAIDQLAMGRLVLDEGGRVLRANAAAQKLLAAKRGISLKNERLHLSSHNDNQAFKQLLDEVMQAHLKREPGFVRAFRLDQQSGNSLGLLLRPMPQAKTSEGFQQPAIAIFISDPDQRREAPAHILVQLFGFTPAESRLALLLANGLTLDESSAELEVSRNTAKSHLSSIFSKTGVTRQTKLVQLILNSVAPMG